MVQKCRPGSIEDLVELGVRFLESRVGSDDFVHDLVRDSHVESVEAGVEVAFVEEDSGYLDHDGLLIFLVGEAAGAHNVREVSVESIDASNRMSAIDGGFRVSALELFQHALFDLVELVSNMDCMSWFEVGVIAIVSGNLLVSELQTDSGSRDMEAFYLDGSTFDLAH